MEKPKIDSYENQMDTKNPWRSLAYAIIAQAARDFVRTRSQESEQFFKSGWFQLLLGDNLDAEWLYKSLNVRKPAPKKGARGALYEGKSINEWELLLGFGHGTLWTRIKKKGMSFEEAIKKPVERTGGRKYDEF